MCYNYNKSHILFFQLFLFPDYSIWEEFKKLEGGNLSPLTRLGSNCFNPPCVNAPAWQHLLSTNSQQLPQLKEARAAHCCHMILHGELTVEMNTEIGHRGGK